MTSHHRRPIGAGDSSVTDTPIRRIHGWKLLSVVTWWKYLRAARRARQGRITDHPLQAPWLVILDRDATIRFLYRGETLGDYPPIPHLLDARQIAGAPDR